MNRIDTGVSISNGVGGKGGDLPWISPRRLRPTACVFMCDSEWLLIVYIIFFRVHVIHLALYNLVLTEEGKKGFFRWNTDICRFIEVRCTRVSN